MGGPKNAALPPLEQHARGCCVFHLCPWGLGAWFDVLGEGGLVEGAEGESSSSSFLTSFPPPRFDLLALVLWALNSVLRLLDPRMTLHLPFGLCSLPAGAVDPALVAFGFVASAASLLAIWGFQGTTCVWWTSLSPLLSSSWVLGVVATSFATLGGWC
ncbi:hypothetical protein BU15DRAFT_81521 [Melanogaster broomeanus]|nr:hypothetical protein BU15DRAFT_81521 [Melanogaster broomeanus]